MDMDMDMDMDMAASLNKLVSQLTKNRYGMCFALTCENDLSPNYMKAFAIFQGIGSD